MLPTSFFQRDVNVVAKKLIGQQLCTNIDGEITSGIIVETESYSYVERGCHGYQNKKTKRNAPMFEMGGISYIYLCYGMHHMFNIVTGTSGKSEAVLIRALQPTLGIEVMQERRKQSSIKLLTKGPGMLSKALALHRCDSGCSITTKKIWLEEGRALPLYSTQRIGIDYAGEDAFLPWRYVAKNNKWVSKP